MSNPDPYEVTYSPGRTFDLTNVQFSDYSQVQVQDFSKVQYFEASDEDKGDGDGEGDEALEDENDKDDGEKDGDGVLDGEGKCFPSVRA